MNSTLYNARIVSDAIFTEVIKDRLKKGQVLYVSCAETDYKLDDLIQSNVSVLENFIKCSNIHSFTPLHFDYVKCSELEGCSWLVTSLTNGACLMAEINEDDPNVFMAILHHFVRHYAEVNDACIRNIPIESSISHQIVLSEKEYTFFLSLFACGTNHDWENIERQHIEDYLRHIDQAISHQLNLYLIQHDISVFQGCGESSYTSAGRCVTVTVESPEANYIMKMPASIVSIWKKINDCTDPTKKSELLEKMVEKSQEACDEMCVISANSAKKTLENYILQDDNMKRNRSVDKVFEKVKILVQAAHQPEILNDLITELFRLMKDKKIKDPSFYDRATNTYPYKNIIYGKSFVKLLNDRYPESRLDPAQFDVFMRKRLCQRAEQKR